MLKDGVSVIVCCYNSASRIAETLRHLALQETAGVDCEIILVDNASTDETVAVAQSAWHSYNHTKINFRHVAEASQGIVFARIKGISEALYQYIVFCDDDNWLDKHYIKTVYQLFTTKPHIGVLGGSGMAYFEDENKKPAWFDSFSYSYATGNLGPEELIVNGVFGAGLALRTLPLRNLLKHYQLQLSGRKQNNLTGGDDSEICNLLRLSGYQVLYSPQLNFRHYIPLNRLSWPYLLKLHTGFANTYVILNLYNKAIDSGLKKLPAFFWLKQCMYYWGIYFKYWYSQYKVYKNGPGSSEEINHITWRTIAVSYLKYNFKTVALYKNMFSLKQQISPDSIK